MLCEHLVHEVQGSVAGRLRAKDRAAPFHALTGEHTLELVGQLLILAEQVTYLAGTHTDIACRHVLVGTDMTVQLSHECLTELHHLIVALTADAEVGAAFATTHRQRCEGVLKGLFESEELQDAKVDG